jgi:hypothetical protein
MNSTRGASTRQLSPVRFKHAENLIAGILVGGSFLFLYEYEYIFIVSII